MPDGGTLYAAVLCRLPEVRSGCRSKSAKRRPIPHTRRKRGEDPWRIGARFPGESSGNGDFRPKTKKVPSEERSKPYISRCRVSYCRRRRRVATTDGGLPARQRAWAGVTSVRKWPAGGGGSWIARGKADWCEMPDAEGGREGERFTLSRARSQTTLTKAVRTGLRPRISVLVSRSCDR